MQAIGSTFRTGEPSLAGLLVQIRKGEIQIPDFQRGWVWDDEHIRSLIASVSLSYPIGAVMLMETGGDGVRFQPRPVEGVESGEVKSPDLLVLDGQQRLTSLFLALATSRPVPTSTEKGREIDRYYYLDIPKCLDPEEERIDAVVSISPDRRVTADFGRAVLVDLTAREKEIEAAMFPLSLVFDQTAYAAWRRGWQRTFRHDDAKLDQFDEFEAQVLQRFHQYRIPTIELLRDTPKIAVCQVFEKVNRGGVDLTVFELVTATFAADDFRLRLDWEEREDRLKKHPVLTSVDPTAFLTSLTLLASYERRLATGSPVSCKRKDVLNLTLEEYRGLADRVEQGFKDAARSLVREKIFDAKNLPYATQLIPLAGICSALGSRFDEEPVKEKIRRWFWCGVFGELYGGANETRFSLDLPETIAWIDGGEEPRTVTDSAFAPTRILTLQSRLSAAYKGVTARLMQVGCHDFLSGDPIEMASYFDLAVDIHHVFPRAWCEKQGLPRKRWNSVANKALISARTNRILGGRAPSSYLGKLADRHGMTADKLDGILRSHRIDPDLLRNDDFGGFLRARASALLDLIEQATGRAVSGRDADEVVAAFDGPLEKGGGL